MGNWRKIHGQLEKKTSATFTETIGNVWRSDRQRNPHQGSMHDDQKQHLIANQAE